MHILLTGESKVGKTTLKSNFLSQSGYSADGFLTFWEERGHEGRRLFLAAYDLHEKYLLNVDNQKTFDTAGVRILEDSGRHDIIVMDELGVLASEALKFQESVFKRLDGNVPILGVIKPAQTEFLDKVRAHPNVKVIEVSVKNRDAVLKDLLEMNWKR
jgi:nucleoside-triphosphatase